MLSQERIDEFTTRARIAEPREMSGLLFDAGFILCRNTAKDPEREFNIEIEEYEHACKWMCGKPWAIVHSHPGRGASPSAKDCALMDALQIAGQDMAMVIIGLNPVEIRCYKKRGDLYPLQWAYWNKDGKWWGPKMGDVVTIKRVEPLRKPKTLEEMREFLNDPTWNPMA